MWSQVLTGVSYGVAFGVAFLLGWIYGQADGQKVQDWAAAWWRRKKLRLRTHRLARRRRPAELVVEWPQLAEFRQTQESRPAPAPGQYAPVELMPDTPENAAGNRRWRRESHDDQRDGTC